MDSKKVRAGSTELSYYDEGKGNRIVLIHGFAGSKQYWGKIIPQLADEHRVIALDLPGHGASGLEKDKNSIEDMAETVKELLDQLELDQVTMFGHSLGGYITLAFAELYPQYLNGFSLVHSTANQDSEEAKEARETNAKKIQEEGAGPFIEGLSRKLFSPDNTEVNAKEIEETVKIGMTTKVEGLVSALVAMKNRPDRNQVLVETALPVLLIAGEHDQIIPAEKTFTVTKSNIEKKTIKDAGHMSMYEQTEELVTVMKDFLEKI
ncbi:alpha/beta fold hydrolase [Mesobacillus boroniphilus]|uniref:Alpha/beta fold hydrolase n=1 Tax=Mesobacillus boroniphilus TaxID=308892 RepID=A0A944GWY1_9BACI|nr:alpha/beta fold hydrolase [Mesobacillus boroniphilus]MBS8264130.1 alpha/beta fold hydrolase [Mesobacillus boroniphilus]